MAIDMRTLAAWPWRAVAGASALAVLAGAAIFPVAQDRTALVLRLGHPLRVINEAGLALCVPWVDRVVWLDQRLMTLAVTATTVTAADGQTLSIDAFATWRVRDPIRFYQTLGTADTANDSLRAVFVSALRDGFARESGQNGALRSMLDRDLARYGITVTDVRLSRVGLPEGAALDAALARMAGKAQADAAAITEEGHRDAAVIRATAAARAGQIYAASFGKDPQFYDFYRAMQSYEATFGQKGSRTTIVLSPDNAYLRQFRGH